MKWIEIIQNARLSFGFAEGNGLGAVLLAVVLISAFHSSKLRPAKIGKLIRLLKPHAKQ